MKRNLIILTLMVLVTLAGCGIGARYQILKTQEDIKIKSPKKELRKGEKLTYKIEWMGMDVGIVTLSVEGIKKQNGSKAYHLLGTVTSTQIISKLYKIE
ncbi:MAG: DUF3108 domain-containing protein, partial [Candidatus Omnitrophota bacterium]|nr:DUF3108 domain-containing protein [Candidatus Omnitrophota bacterium]